MRISPERTRLGQRLALSLAKPQKEQSLVPLFCGQISVATLLTVGNPKSSKAVTAKTVR